jgi:hypothetical protein
MIRSLSAMKRGNVSFSPRKGESDMPALVADIHVFLAASQQLRGSRLPGWIDPAALLDSTLGPLASEETRRTIARAESHAQARGAQTPQIETHLEENRRHTGLSDHARR